MTHLRSPLTTVLADGLELGHVAGKGLGYIARLPLKAGCTIMKEDGLRSCVCRRHDPESIFLSKMLLTHKLIGFLPSFPPLGDLRAPTPMYQDTADILVNVPTPDGCCRDMFINLFAICRIYTFEGGESYDEDANRVFIFKPQAVFLNHSCDPNALESVRCGVMALRDIDPGEEVCICYSPELLCFPFSRRQELLKSPKGWAFACSCSRCQLALPCDAELTGTKDGGLLPRQVAAMRNDFELCVGLHKQWEVDRKTHGKQCLDAYLRFLKTWHLLADGHWRRLYIGRRLCIVLFDMYGPPSGTSLAFELTRNESTMWEDVVWQQVEAERRIMSGWPASRVVSLEKYVLLFSSDDGISAHPQRERASTAWQEWRRLADVWDPVD